MRRCAAVFVLLAWCGPAWGQVTLPKEVSGEVATFIRIPAEAKGQVQWYAPDAGLTVFPAELLKDSRTAVVVAVKPGRYRLVAWTAVGDVPSPPSVCVVIVGTPPDPKPEPPDPKPEPKPPAPGPVSGLRVLIVEESAERAKLPKGQYNVLFDKSVRAWLNANCRAWEGWKDWGIFDKDTDLSGYSKDLQALMARPRQSLPWIVIAGDGGVAYEGPLPADVPSTLSLLGRFTPAKRKAG